jgi:acyl-CoA reductase-like NAD-dependent aldehyde dehydrogenase
MSRLPVQKTIKLYMGGKFSRSESGQSRAVKGSDGGIMNVCTGSRKDFRNCMETARSAQGAWEGRTAYNRGQILYRLAEILEGRTTALPTSKKDTFAAIDRAVHHSGWADKVSALLSTLNPVASTYVNYSRVRGIGVVVAAPDPKDGLLGMVEAICAATVMGNAVILLVEHEAAELSIALAEALATCDMPGGVVNILTTDVEAVLRVAICHDDVDALYLATGPLDKDFLQQIHVENATVMRRMLTTEGAAKPAAPIDLSKLAEVQTVWMSSLEMKGGAAAY